MQPLGKIDGSPMGPLNFKSWLLQVLWISKVLNYNPAKIHITYQSEPAFHKQKVEEFILELEKNKEFEVTKHHYQGETHNSLFLDSFYQGIQLTNK